MSQTTRCGYVAIVGRPNVGKSTLLNCILGKKISITTSKPQTTRTQILGVKTTQNAQIVYIDTPGIHETEGNAMNRYMNRMANAVIQDADVVVFMIEATRWDHEDEQVLNKLKQTKSPVILVLNKVDALDDRAEVLPLINKLKEKFEFADIVPLSARQNDNVMALQQLLVSFLPEGPFLFPADQVTDKPVRFQIAELIREKVIQSTGQEVPYSTTVEIENLEEKENLTEISAIIWVERDGQKAIVIGKAGERLKKIGTEARKDIQNLLGRKVFLRLWVKVKDNWTNDERALRSLGLE